MTFTVWSYLFVHFIRGYIPGIQFLTILSTYRVTRMHPEVLDNNLDTTVQGANLYVFIFYCLLMP
jgi:hypothetical protein